MNILISGASLAGPALAFWLARAGHLVTIVERAPALRLGGYAIDIRGPALTICEGMGILPQVRRESTDTLSNVFVDERGRELVTFARGFGVISPQDVEIMRGTLTQILFERTRDHTRYIFGDSITALAQDHGGVSVTFARHPAERFDAVIGADGLHSNVRALAFGDEAQFLRGLGSSLAIFSAPNVAGLDRAQHMIMGPGRVVSIKSDRGNAGVKVTFIFASGVIDRADGAAQKRAVTNAFGHMGGHIPALLREMESAPDFYFDSVSQTRMPSWHHGRVALVGDAAFAPSLMTGQGTSLAITGAYLLACAMNEAPDLAGAFARYETEARPFIEDNQDAALASAKSFAPATAFGAWFRNVNLRLLPYLPWRDLLFTLMMKEIKRAATALTLEPPEDPEGTHPPGVDRAR